MRPCRSVIVTPSSIVSTDCSSLRSRANVRPRSTNWPTRAPMSATISRSCVGVPLGSRP
jgi:hypothetical protein